MNFERVNTKISSTVNLIIGPYNHRFTANARDEKMRSLLVEEYPNPLKGLIFAT